MTPDIREKAERLARNWFRGGHAGLADDISQALLEAHNAGREEMREEAAGLCEKKANTHGWNYHLPSVGRWLATAIRSIT